MLNIFVGNSLLGDALATLGAVEAFARSKEGPVNLALIGPPTLFCEDNPWINILPISELPKESSWVKLDCHYAFNSAVGRQAHMAEGHYLKLGLNPIKYRPCKAKFYLPGLKPEEVLQSRIGYQKEHGEYIVFAPFSASCGRSKGETPNKTMSLEENTNLASSLQKEFNLPVFTMGNSHEPEVPGTINWRGRDLKDVLYHINGAKLVIGVDTGLLWISSVLDQDIVQLNSALPEYMIKHPTLGKLEFLQSKQDKPFWDTKSVLDATNRILSK
jgi:ADP-heptose:LPS heptosyltransferase